MMMMMMMMMTMMMMMVMMVLMVMVVMIDDDNNHKNSFLAWQRFSTVNYITIYMVWRGGDSPPINIISYSKA